LALSQSTLFPYTTLFRSHWRKEAINEQHNLLKNAYLMPFETRELAEQFLEANQPNFKVGLLFSKKKTDIERENRLETFALNVKKDRKSTRLNSSHVKISY